MAVSVPALCHWMYGFGPARLAIPFAQVTGISQMALIFLLTFFLGRYRGTGLAMIVFAAALFYVLVFKMRGPLVYPGTFEFWMLSAKSKNQAIFTSVLAGYGLGLALSGLNIGKIGSFPESKKGITVLFSVTILLAGLNIVLNQFYGEKNLTFALNQPIGVIICLFATFFGLMIANYLDREDEIAKAVSFSRR
ncbi:hypothetical protein QPK87_11060 [Kamptonema cortianum]|nr:hypothetical protein [Geitlerinema splendidum]MDK3157113.1 hypothetical protein [Kamptonema cortianum]